MDGMSCLQTINNVVKHGIYGCDGLFINNKLRVRIVYLGCPLHKQ